MPIASAATAPLGFLPWHMSFFCRYRPLPEAEYAELAARQPLIHTRWGPGEVLPPAAEQEEVDAGAPFVAG